MANNDDQSETTIDTIQTATTDTAAAALVGSMAVPIGERMCDYDGDTGPIPVGINAHGTIRVLDDVLKVDEARAPSPRRRKGTQLLDELDSFIAYVQRHQNTDTVVWADLSRFQVDAVFNEHPEGGALDAAGFRDNRATYACPRSHEWLEWTKNDGKAMRQDAFGDWIEQHLDDLASPNVDLPDFPHPTDVLMMARKLTINTGGKYKRDVNPTTGEATLVAVLEHTTDSTKIPRAFLLKIPVFQNGTPYFVEARLRFQMVDGAPAFTYILHNRVAIERDAFTEVRTQIAERCHLNVFAGKVG